MNSALSDENAALRNSIEKFVKGRKSRSFIQFQIQFINSKYIHTSATVIDNSINRQKNFFTINKGLKQGITKDMAVTAGNGVAGVIVGCSENYSIAMSMLNLDFRLSARIKSNGYYGSLSWEGRDYRKAILSEIPQHVQC